MSLEKELFNLKFAAKSLEREANKCLKSEAAEKQKVKSALQKNKVDVAKIYAENAIRQRNQHLTLLTMSAKIGAVASRVETAHRTNQLTKSMKNVVGAMDKASRAMNLERITQLMDDFENQFETLDVKTGVMEGAMNSTTTLLTPQNQVDSLMHEIADEARIDLKMDMPSAQNTTLAAGTSVKEQDELTERLAKLRQT